MQGNPHNVEGQPPESEGTVEEETNPERQGPGPTDAPTEQEQDPGAPEAPSGPPPESLPGGDDEGPSPNE